MTEEITDEALDAAAADAPADNVLTDDVAQTDNAPETGTNVPNDNTDIDEAGDVDNIDVVDDQIDALESDDIPDEPEDHGERSALGRKVGDNHRDVTAKLERMQEQMESYFQGVRSEQPTQRPPEPAYDDNEEIPMTMGELNKWYNNRVNHDRQLQDEDATRYESGYRNTFSELSKDLEPTEAKKIEDEMLANYNVRHSNDPQLDAERNFLRAENSLLRNRPPEKPQTNLRQGKPTGGKSGNNYCSTKSECGQVRPHCS